MRERIVVVALALAMSVACGSREDETESAPVADEASPATAPRASEPAPGPAAPDRARDVAGLTVTLEPSGAIRITGTDRFGGDASTVFESAQYLEDALPVLARSLTPAQVDGLRAIVVELRTASR